MIVAARYHEFVNRVMNRRFALQNRQKFHFSLRPEPAPATLHGVVLRVFVRAVYGRSVLDRARQPVGFHLCPHLRHVMPEHDDVVLLAVDVPDMVPQQGLGLEAQALK